MLAAALFSLEVFALVALVDGVYFHLMKYRLFARPASRYEHLLHTIHAVFFPLLVVLLFLSDASGVYLWATVALVAADFAVEMMDVVCERASRMELGGLSTAEYAVHVLAITSRVAAFTLALAARPAPAWRLTHGAIREANVSPFVAIVCWVVVAGGIGMAALHVWLMVRHTGRTADSPVNVPG